MSLENETTSYTEFTPFNDTDQPRIEQAILSLEFAVQGYDTTNIDRYRQGVEVKVRKHQFNSTQPKIGSGNLSHIINVTTYGQARSWTEYEDSIVWFELPRFDPVWYIQDIDYPFPIVFNEGPQQEEESIMEPFTIPMRKHSPEGPEYAHAVRGSSEDGPSGDLPSPSTIPLGQYIEYASPVTADWFLDEGSYYMGGGDMSDAIMIEGYLTLTKRLLDPFNETKSNRIIEQLSTEDSAFIAAIRNMQYNLASDIRGTHSLKSAPAGSTVYGPEASRYGTDSIAFCGVVRGG